MAAVRHTGFQKFEVFLSLTACRSASWYTISLKSDNRLMSYGQKSDLQDGGRPPSSFLKISFFGHVTVIGLNICCNVPNFIEIGRFLPRVYIARTMLRQDVCPSVCLSVCHTDVFCGHRWTGRLKMQVAYLKTQVRKNAGMKRKDRKLKYGKGEYKARGWKTQVWKG